MSFLGVDFPPELCERFREISCPGEKVGPDTYHITLLFLGKSTPLPLLCKAVEAAAPAIYRTRPFEITAREVSYFPENPDDRSGHPIIAKIESPELHQLRQLLARSFDAGGVPYSKKFPDYRPHVTLSYSPTPHEQQLEEPIVGTVDSLTLWGGESYDGPLRVRFMLSKEPALPSPIESLEAEVRSLLSS